MNARDREDDLHEASLLTTAQVLVKDSFNKSRSCRALLDNGATMNFITWACVNKLALATIKTNVKISGLGSFTVGRSSKAVNIVIKSRNEMYEFSMQALVVPSISNKLPHSEVDWNNWSHLKGISLADPNFYKPGEIDILLGADLFYLLVEGRKKHGLPHEPVAIDSKLGWLVGGGSNNSNSQIKISRVWHTNVIIEEKTILDQILRKFWEIEDTPEEKPFTQEELECEEHFIKNWGMNAEGRIVVRYPFKSPAVKLGDSMQMAMRRFLQVEKRLKSNEEYYADYRKFMKDYEDLNHMIEVNPPTRNCTRNYLPHHFVVTAAKFRVVFDASAKTSNGHSLNDSMMVGRIPQSSLIDMLIRFRTHKIAIIADIEKMYRQILVSPEDQNCQYIVWRKDQESELKHYKLLTVTYGTAAAPFLSTRSLQEIANKEREAYPEASEVLENDVYMDDAMTGAEDEDAAIKLQRDLRIILDKVKMPLRKFTSNSEKVLESIPSDLKQTQSLMTFKSDSESVVKALGIYWNPATDQFGFRINKLHRQPFEQMTKRILASEIAKLFDPIGWISPVIVTAKIMLQGLWKLKIDWDNEVPVGIVQRWNEFVENLSAIEKIQIPRFYLTEHNMTLKSNCSTRKTCLIGFADASDLAYGACVYLCVYEEEKSSVSLVAGKSKVAPIQTLSTPRLELLAAELLAKLIIAVKKSLKVQINEIRCFTDAKDVLAWIQGDASRWKKFIASRVSKIQEKVSPNLWFHVKGKENPADLVSRGVEPKDLIHNELWWQGPSWLQHWSTLSMEAFSTDLEKKKVKCHFTRVKTKSQDENKTKNETTTNEDFVEVLLKRYSNFYTVLRCLAWIKRYALKCWGNAGKKLQVSKPTMEGIIPLTPSEVQRAKQVLVKYTQESHFGKEIECLMKGQTLSKKSKILPLAPFLDKDGVLRVGGRLRNSDLPYNQKHPILLPNHHLFTKLLVHDEHIANMHAGPQALLSKLQQDYWIIRGKDTIRSVIHRCVKCAKIKGETMNQIMADLPSFRVNQAFPFMKVGVDYAGPFLTKANVKRSKVTIKAYLAIFVCCTTRAIHLEAVSDLTTDAFLAALRRFISRRGKPSDIYSDCGSNFKGANAEMKEFIQFVSAEPHNETVANKLTDEGIAWHFNPPGAPHFGGLWEAGVKSTKFHLRRVVGEQRLTFEELQTIVNQIEAILNSRPLTPESSDPSDLRALTPGHFLIGRPITSFPEPDLSELKENRLSNWQLIQRITQNFWKRWNAEYISTLQQRSKWTTPQQNIEVGSLVLIKDENLPPLKWKLGRIMQVHEGKDKKIRTVTVRTAYTELTRPIVKICLLPVER